MRILAFLSFLSCVNLVYTINCTANQFESKTGLCCKLCSAGEYMSKECEQAGETTCLPCPKNEFTTTQNNVSSCQKCRDVQVLLCDGGRHLQACTPTSDIHCKCPVNKYWNTHTLRCKECTVCERGERLTSHCETYKDAVCEKCQQGTYLDSSDNCVPCSYCRKGEIVVQECVMWEDTICKKMNDIIISPSQQTYPPKPSTEQDPYLHSRLPQSTMASGSQQDYPSQPPAPCNHKTFSDGVTWLLLGVVMVLLFVVVFLLRCVIKRKQKIQTPSEIPKDSVVNEKPTGTTCVKENNVMFNTVSADVIEDLANFLNSNHGKNYKHLAGAMKYNSVFTANLELIPTEACQRLLQDWQQRSDATVYALYSFLRQLGRDDAASLLLPLLVESSKSEMV